MSEGSTIGQEAPSDADLAPRLRFAAQPQPQPEQPIASKFQESEEATGSAADSTAEPAGFSSSGGGGGRYMSVPPSSLWGPPAGVGVTTSSAAAQTAEAESQQLPSPGGDVPGNVGHSQHGSEDQDHSVHHHHTTQPPAVEHEELESQAIDQQSAEEDASMPDVEADLARAQRAQREALEAEDASLQSSRKALLEVREAIQLEQRGPVSQNQDQVISSSMAPTGTEGRQGGGLAPVQEADREADDTILEAGAVLSDEPAARDGQGRQADDTLAQTAAALAGAQEAQQQAVQAGQEALAEERHDLVQLRQDLQQQPGQPAKSVCCSALCNCCSCYNTFGPMSAVCCTLNRLACHRPVFKMLVDSCLRVQHTKHQILSDAIVQ